MDKIINWFLLIIIFVFDPLAIALVIAANFAFAQLLQQKEEPEEDIQEEMREWEEASLTDLHTLEQEEEQVAAENTDTSEPIETISQLQADIKGIQNSPHFSEWKKKQLIEERLKQARSDENGIRYW
jgi:hypothetical protein